MGGKVTHQGFLYGILVVLSQDSQLKIQRSNVGRLSGDVHHNDLVTREGRLCLTPCSEGLDGFSILLMSNWLLPLAWRSVTKSIKSSSPNGHVWNAVLGSLRTAIIVSSTNPINQLKYLHILRYSILSKL